MPGEFVPTAWDESFHTVCMFNALKVVAGQGISVGPILLGAAKPRLV